MKHKFFKGNVPPAPVEFDLNENGNKVNLRRVDHIRYYNGKTYRYHATKGWKPVFGFNMHNLLNSLFVKNGFGTIYSSSVIDKVYGIPS